MGFNSFAWNCEGLFLGALAPIYNYALGACRCVQFV